MTMTTAAVVEMVTMPTAVAAVEVEMVATASGAVAGMVVTAASIRTMLTQSTSVLLPLRPLLQAVRTLVATAMTTVVRPFTRRRKW